MSASVSGRAILALCCLAGIIPLACSGGGPRTSSTPPEPETVAPTPTPDPFTFAFEGGPYPLPEPVRVTEGDWVPPALSEDAQVRGDAIWQDAQDGALDPEAGLQGQAIDLNGFRIGGPQEADAEGSRCAYGRKGTQEEHPLRIDYLPPNTFETHEPASLFCRDGWVGYAARVFQVSKVSLTSLAVAAPWPEASFIVRYISSARVSPTFVSLAASVSAATVNDRPAVFIEPVTPEGYGPSHVFIATDDDETGFLEISATHLSFDEVVKIAQGVSCPAC